ncbi:MAG: glycoside hydrolase family 16 protein [Planctomycetes bacterium]|nr:glycoside hydrolase family 16 protein [Planctomycetota bacterium]
MRVLILMLVACTVVQAEDQPAPAIPTAPAPEKVKGSYVPDGYELTFSDDFDGDKLDPKKWKTRYIYANETQDRLNDEQQRFRDNGNHVVEGGTLKLLAKKVGKEEKTEKTPYPINYESGMIRSTHTQKYGYFEARVKFCDAIGIWPAFWLNSDYGPDKKLSWPPEIDIFEYVINGKEDTEDMIHCGVVSKPSTAADKKGEQAQGRKITYSDPAYNKKWTFYKAPESLANKWITAGLEWTETSATIFIDGKKIVSYATKWVYNDGTDAPPAHILLNLAVGGQWPGRHGIDDSKLPFVYEIDWVRAYKKK